MQHPSLSTVSLLIVITLATSACLFGDHNHDNLDDTSPYIAESTYSEVLKGCAMTETATSSCTLNVLPPLGMEHPSPTIAHIMDRVIVSHDWMGERFEQLLNNVPEDIHQLLGAVTVIVIDADIRPSYYHNLTGAIYLDPANLWMSQDEKHVINRKDDHRAAYADPMDFRSRWRYIKDNKDAYTYYGLSSTDERPFDDILFPMSSLLYHELAHANDIFPVNQYGSVNKEQSIYDVTESLKDEYPSTMLKNDYPLESSEMFNLANILFKGVSPSNEDIQITATQVGDFFAPDRANDDYSYTSQFEDAAMLFEEAMMKFHFNVDRDTAYVDYPGAGKDCNEQIVAWGVRNRIGEERVKQRLKLILEQILPSQDYSNFLNDLPAPSNLPNIGWCASKDLTPSGTAKSSEATNKVHIQSRHPKPVPPENMTRLYKIHL